MGLNGLGISMCCFFCFFFQLTLGFWCFNGQTVFGYFSGLCAFGCLNGLGDLIYKGTGYLICVLMDFVVFVFEKWLVHCASVD